LTVSNIIPTVSSD